MTQVPEMTQEQFFEMMVRKTGFTGECPKGATWERVWRAIGDMSVMAHEAAWAKEDAAEARRAARRLKRGQIRGPGEISPKTDAIPPKGADVVSA